MKLLPSSAALALTAVCAGIVGTAQAETSAWTGCITPGGTIIHMAQGDDPLKACAPNQQLVHLNDVAAFQHTEANYDQAKMCEAFHELMLSAPALEKLGCPSTPTLTKPGTVERIFGQDYRDNEAIGNENVCGILGIEPASSYGFKYVLNDGFVASTEVIPLAGGLAACGVKCAADAKCVAANFIKTKVNTSSGTCRTFHHSDALSVEWSNWCGLSKDGENGQPLSTCLANMDTTSSPWFVRVPFGQSAQNCPGAAPIP
jgi:hypothetical protein